MEGKGFSVNPKLVRWMPPPEGWLKVNTDASFCNGKAGLAVVVRDSLGQVQMLKTRLLRSHLTTAG